ncbi:MAG: N-acetylneuraminate synthase [Oscillospiraceae bacterium]|jgi:N,N'-diacetyllegionaminate synthase|nr:N-acetylneuraminate synthase [Oscillospiraceae bacterium]
MAKIFIIAEAGDNHNGDIKLAKKLVDVAKKSGASAVKFQTFKSENLVVKNAPKAEYQLETTGSDESQFEMLKSLELSFSEFKELSSYCKKVGIIFLSTAFDLDSVHFLSELDLPIWKIPSGEITNLPYLIEVAKIGKPMIVSTGMCEIFEIEEALKVIRDYSSSEITLLHCNTEYPTPPKDVNLLAMRALGERFCCKFGYSDHTTGVLVPVAAAALGASVIEKHFTLDNTMPGPDHKASLLPHELDDMVKAIRTAEIILGSPDKTVSESERKNIIAARKSIVAKTFIKEGEIFTDKNLTTKRPAGGMSPMEWFNVIGKKSNKNYFEDEMVKI